MLRPDLLISIGNTNNCHIIIVSWYRAILKSNCYHDQGHKATCHYKTTNYMLLFGAVQILVSQIPEFRNTEWLSAIAAIMSFTYSLIGSGLGLAKVIGKSSTLYSFHCFSNHLIRCIKALVGRKNLTLAFVRIAMFYEILYKMAFLT